MEVGEIEKQADQLKYENVYLLSYTNDIFQENFLFFSGRWKTLMKNVDKWITKINKNWTCEK